MLVGFNLALVNGVYEYLGISPQQTAPVMGYWPQPSRAAKLCSQKRVALVKSSEPEIKTKRNRHKARFGDG